MSAMDSFVVSLSCLGTASSLATGSLGWAATNMAALGFYYFMDGLDRLRSRQ